MKNKILAIVAMALMTGPMAANAMLVTYDFTWTGTAGPNAGSTSSGFLTYDNSLITNGGYTGTLVAFSFSWAGFSYDETDILAGFRGSGDTLNSLVLGTDCVAAGSSGGIGCGTANSTIGDFYMWFDPFRSFEFWGATARDQGTVAFSLRPTEVPEPATLALFGLGLAGLAFARRRKLN